MCTYIRGWISPMSHQEPVRRNCDRSMGFVILFLCEARSPCVGFRPSLLSNPISQSVHGRGQPYGAGSFLCWVVRRSMWDSGGDQDCSMAVRLHFLHAQLKQRNRRQIRQPGNLTELENSLIRQLRGHARLADGGGEP